MAMLEELKEMSRQTASHFQPEAQNQLPGSSLPQSTTGGFGGLPGNPWMARVSEYIAHFAKNGCLSSLNFIKKILLKEKGVQIELYKGSALLSGDL